MEAVKAVKFMYTGPELIPIQLIDLYLDGYTILKLD